MGWLTVTAQFIEKPTPLPSSWNCLIYHTLTFHMLRHACAHTSVWFFLNFCFLDLFIRFLLAQYLSDGLGRMVAPKGIGTTLFKCWKKELLPQSVYLVKLFFRNEWEIRTYSDQRKLKEFVTRKPALKEWLNEFSRGRK